MIKHPLCLLIALFLFFTPVPSRLSAQTIPPEWEVYLEQYAESEDTPELLESLENLATSPLDINQATAEELLQIPGLSETLIREILKLRRKKGPFSSLDEVQKALKIDPDLWNWIRQFLKVSSPGQKWKIKIQTRHRVLYPIEMSRGFTEGVFLGNPLKIYQRYNVHLTPRLKGGILLEKDSGEPDLNDHTVGFIHWRHSRTGTDIYLGNYSINLGTGLLLYSPMAFRQYAGFISFSTGMAAKIQPYLSALEYGYQQGIALHLKKKEKSLMVWVSMRPVDATIKEGTISSFDPTGLHRNQKEQDRANQGRLEMLGLSFQDKLGSHLSWQFNLLKARCRPSIKLPGLFPESRDSLLEQLFGGSFVFHASAGSYSLIGEVASLNRQNALFAAWNSSWRGVEVSVGYRNYAARYPDIFANGYRSSGGTQNENGWFIRCNFKPFGKSKILLARDQYSIGTTASPLRLPYSGSWLHLQWQQKFDDQLSGYILYSRNEKMLLKETIEHRLKRKQEVPFLLERWRYNLRIQPAPQQLWFARIECVRFGQHGIQKDSAAKELGWLISWGTRLEKSPFLNLIWHVTFFDTPSYNTRLYQYEYDLPGSFTSQLLYGQGLRTYAMLQLSLPGNIRLSLRYAITRYENRTYFGSGWDRVYSAFDRLFSFQLDWRR